jgi:hypothetical protein
VLVAVWLLVGVTVGVWLLVGVTVGVGVTQGTDIKQVAQSTCNVNTTPTEE